MMESHIVCDIKVKVRRSACFPIVLEAVVEVPAAQGDDGVGAVDGSEHAGLFEAGADYGFAAGFNPTRADEQMLAAELWVAHTLGIGSK